MARLSPPIRRGITVDNARTVSVYFDYQWEWPLWDEQGTLHPSELGVSDSLEELMQQWYDHWSQHHSPAGWDAPSAHVEHLQQGIVVLENLRREVPGVSFQPRFHLWG